jgi:murein DD-endopeptidase MepM/ murein hydrolase activator NlpD
MFLRSPLRYSHVTSVFSRRRFHPVLKQYRPHYGVDYGAPVGTPVQVTANGVVTFAGWDRGGGKVVKVQNPGGYVTAYLHLSRFASGIRPGARVRQGDIVAFTGATGLASGPHLDYRVKLRNEWIDPLALKSVRDEPIPSSRLASFRSWRDELRSGLRDGVISRDLRIPGAAPESQYATNGAAPRAQRGSIAR